MGKMRFAVAVLALFMATPAAADPFGRWRPYIEEASARFGIPAEWIERVMRAESGGRTTLNGRPTTSHAGAMGLMQLMPGTWAEMRRRLGLGRDPHHPRDNIMAGTFYLRLMYDRFGYPGLFAAYNAGPARYVRHLATGRPLPGETRVYLAAVSGTAAAAMRPRMPAARPQGGIFFAPAHLPASDDTPEHSSGLFVALRGTPARPPDEE